MSDTVSILRPDGVVGSLNGWAVVQGSAPANTADSVLADNNDDSYVKADAVTGNDNFQVSFGTVALPTLAEIKSVTVRLRLAQAAGAQTILVDLFNHSNYSAITFAVPTSSITTEASAVFTTRPDGGDWTQADIDALKLRIGVNAPDDMRVYAAYIDVAYNQAPVTTVTGPADPDTTTATPDVTWTVADPETDAQVAYEIVVWEASDYSDSMFDASSEAFFGGGSYYSTTLWTYREYIGGGYQDHAPSWRSGDKFASTGAVISAALLATIGNALQNGKTYRAYVRVGDVGRTTTFRFGARSYKQFSTNYSPPSPPSIAVFADDANGRVIVELAAAAGAPSTEYFTLERSTDGGTTWAPVRDAAAVTNPSSGTTTVTVYDYAVPFELPAIYRASATDTGTGSPLVSAWATAASVVLPGGCDTWLKSSSDASLNRAFVTAPDQGSQIKSEGGVFYPQGRRFPIVHLGTHHGETLSVLFSLPDDATYNDLLALWALRETLLIQFPYGDADGYEQHWVRLPADLDLTRLSVSGMHDGQPRRLVLPMIEVAEPA